MEQGHGLVGGLWAVAHSQQAQRALLQEEVDLVERAARETTYKNPTNMQGNKKALKGVENQRRTSAIRRFLYVKVTI